MTAPYLIKRNRDIKRIHAMARKLGLDTRSGKRAAYEDVLFLQTGKISTAEMNMAERWQIIRHLQGLIDQIEGREKKYPGRPKNMDGADSRSEQLKKIEALLAEAGYPWNYADQLARRICRVNAVAWVPDDKLYKIITALILDAKRHGRDLGKGFLHAK